MCDRNSIVWLIDDHEIRLAAFASFLSPWAARAGIDVRPIPTIESLGHDDGNNMADGKRRELCVFAVGGTSQGDASLSDVIRAAVTALAGRPLVLLSDINTDIEVVLAIENGVHGLLSTRMEASVAIAALEFILSGGTYFDKTSLIDICRNMTQTTAPDDRIERLANSHPVAANADTLPVGPDQTEPATRPKPDPASAHLRAVATLGIGRDIQPSLTGRQKEVVEMLKTGRSNKEIAKLLDLSEATVKIFVRQVMKKYGAMNRTQVALLASNAMPPPASNRPGFGIDPKLNSYPRVAQFPGVN